MKNFSEFYKSLRKACVVFLLAAIMLSMAACATTSTTSSDAPQLMFVQIAEDVKVDQQTLYFSDRPQRIAGQLKMADYLKTWKEGRDSFGADPPNATLSVYEPGHADNTLVVVKITNPVVDGTDLVYGFKIINGTMPASGGATSLFIDWFGVGVGLDRASTVLARVFAAMASVPELASAAPESAARAASGGEDENAAEPKPAGRAEAYSKGLVSTCIDSGDMSRMANGPKVQ